MDTFSRPCLGRPSPIPRHASSGSPADGAPHRSFGRAAARLGLGGPAAGKPCRPSAVVEALATPLTVPHGASLGAMEEDYSVGVLQRLQAGTVTLIESKQELEDVLRASGNKVVVLKCRAKHCRPCMAFKKKYKRLAAQFQGAIFLEVLGDASPELRKLMIDFKVKATPTFRVYKKGEPADRVVGINEAKLSRAVRAAMGIAEEELVASI